MDRRRTSRRCTNPRGFTLLELGVAVLVFTLIAGIVTLAVARSQLAGAHARLQTAVESELRRLVGVAGTGNFDELVDGTFTRPDACPSSPHQSCVEILERDFVVSWEVTAVADRTGESSAHAAGLRLQASTSLPDGGDVEIEHFVEPVGGGREGTALLRVRISGETYQGPMYLIDGAGDVVGSGNVTADLALIRAADTACAPTPCRIALRPDGGTSDDNVAFSYGTVAGGATAITLSGETVAEASVVLEPVSHVHVLLYAENPDGRGTWNPQPGSVCLYLQFDHGGDIVDVPGCNTTQPDRVIFATSTPVGTLHAANGTAALPQNTPLTIASDPSGGTCALPEQKGWNGLSGTWETADVCTSWTWGPFDELRDGATGKGAAVAGPLTVTDATTRYRTAVWAPTTNTDPSRPAGGSAGDPLWERPRDIPLCAADSSCTPETGQPETSCPGQHCNSTTNLAPVLTGPRQGTYAIPSVETPAGQTTPMTLTFVDNDATGSITVTAVNPPAGLTIAGNPVSNNDDIIVSGGTNANVTLNFAAGGDFTGATWDLVISDGTYARTETITFTDGTEEAFSLHIEPLTISQGDDTTGKLLAIDTGGEAMTAVTLGASLPTGITLATPTAGGGTFDLVFTATTPDAGVGVGGLSSGDATTTFALTVQSAAGAVTVDDETIDQGDSGTLTATVTDLAGDPAQGRHVWFTLEDPLENVWPLGSVLAARGCITGVAGTCQVAIDVEASAVTGAFSVTAESDQVDGTGTLTVAAALSRIESTGSSVEQGDSVTIDLRAYDGRNEPAAGMTIDLATTTPGVGVPSSVTTGVDGIASVNVTTTTLTPAGDATITLTAGSYIRDMTVEVDPTVSNLSGGAGPFSLAQNGNRTIVITALDPQGNPAPYKEIDVTATAGIYVPASVLTGADGVASVHIAGDKGAAVGNGSITFLYEGTTLRTATVSVIYGVGRVTADVPIVTEDTTRVTLEFRSGNNLPLSGRSIAVSARDRRISVAVVDTATDSSGEARIDVTAGAIPPGRYLLTIEVDGRTIDVEVTA